MKLNISIFGEKNVGKSKLIKDYITEKNFGDLKDKGGYISFNKPFRDGNSMKLNLYEYSDIPDKKIKDIASHQCIIIMFDMTSRKAFEDVLDKWVKFLREIKYSNSIILFGTINYNNPKGLCNLLNPKRKINNFLILPIKIVIALYLVYTIDDIFNSCYFLH